MGPQQPDLDRSHSLWRQELETLVAVDHPAKRPATVDEPSFLDAFQLNVFAVEGELKVEVPAQHHELVASGLNDKASRPQVAQVRYAGSIALRLLLRRDLRKPHAQIEQGASHRVRAAPRRDDVVA